MFKAFGHIIMASTTNFKTQPDSGMKLLETPINCKRDYAGADEPCTCQSCKRQCPKLNVGGERKVTTMIPIITEVARPTHPVMTELPKTAPPKPTKLPEIRPPKTTELELTTRPKPSELPKTTKPPLIWTTSFARTTVNNHFNFP